MKVKEVFQIADALAPKSLSDEMCERYGFYDNSGVLIDLGEKVEKILFSLDLSEGAINKALEEGANVILTHHPAIYGGLSRLDAEEKGSMGAKLVRCMQAGISVISMHLNLDSAEGGIDESLMEGISYSAGERAGTGTRAVSVQYPLSKGGYGRAYGIKPTRLETLCEGIKATFRTERVGLYGDRNRVITRVASFCGAGADEKSVAFALKEGADVFLSSDMKHHVLSLATEAGLAVITLTHYASEQYGFRKYYEKFSRRVAIPCVYHEDSDLL